jgi:TPR repeat protein
MFEDGLNAFGGQKYEKAYQLWKPLAEKGNSDAQYYMGVMFANGQGVKRNYIVAYAWYSVAAEEQDMAEENRDDIEVTLSEPQLAQAKKLAREYTQKYLPQ